MVFMTFSKRERYVFAITITFIVIVVLYNFVFEPGFNKWRILNNEIAVNTAKMDRGLRLLERKEFIIREYNRRAGSDKSISEILSDLEGRAVSLGIKTRNIKPGEVMEAGHYRECAIELEIEGELKNIIKFLSGLVEIPALAVLKKLNLKVISQSPPIFKGTIIISKIVI